MHLKVKAHAILELASGTGRKQRLSTSDEQLIVDVILEFQNNVVPLDRQSIFNLF